MMVPALGNIAIFLLIWNGAWAYNRNLQACPYQLNGHPVRSLGLVLGLILLNSLSLRDHDGQAGFGSRGSSQIMSMVMILLLIV